MSHTFGAALSSLQTEIAAALLVVDLNEDPLLDQRGGSPPQFVAATEGSGGPPVFDLLQAKLGWHLLQKTPATSATNASKPAQGGVQHLLQKSATGVANVADQNVAATNPNVAATKRGFFSNPKTAATAVVEQLRLLQKKERPDVAAKGEMLQPNFDVAGVATDLQKIQSDPKKQQILATAATTAGMPIALFLAQRYHYQQGVKQSAIVAKKLALDIKVPDELKGVKGEVAKQITLMVGGFTRQEGQQGAHFLRQVLRSQPDSGGEATGLRSVFSDHALAAVDNRKLGITMDKGQLNQAVLADFDRGEPLGNIVNKHAPKAINAGSEAYRQALSAMLKHGRNAVAIDLAAKAIAYAQKHPGLSLHLLGLAGGGPVIHEASAILQEAKVKHRAVTLGSPYFGLVEPEPGALTLVMQGDPALFSPSGKQKLGLYQPKILKGTKEGGGYLEHPQVHAALQQFFGAAPGIVQNKSAPSDVGSEGALL